MLELFVGNGVVSIEFSPLSTFLTIYITGGTSVSRFVLDKVRLMCSDLRYSTFMSMSEIKVPNKSISPELNNVKKNGEKNSGHWK